MHKIIVSKIELDLTDRKLTITEENSWFSDSFYTKYSYPFEIFINNKINNEFGDLLSSDSVSGLFKIECSYVFYNKIENALLYVESLNNKTASLSIQYGMDEFPNFDKKLAELELFFTEVPNIYIHANDTVEKKYPFVNYNFPMVHTEKYDPTDSVFNGFENIINKRVNNVFIENVVENDVMYNRNIIQPLPYLMYVLKRGFELSGRILKGNILNDSLLNSMLIFSEKEYVSKIENSGIDILIDEYSLEETTIVVPQVGYEIEKSFRIIQPGRYNLLGTINLGCKVHGFWTGKYASIFISINDQVVYANIEGREDPRSSLVDLFFDVQPSRTGFINIKVISNFYEGTPVVDLQALPIYYYDSEGNKLTNLFNSNKIDLNKSVPNMTFGNFFTIVMNWFNYDVDEITENSVTINKVNDSFINNEIFNLSKFENISTQNKIDHDTNFHLKYQEDGDIDLGGVFIDSNGIIKTSKEFNKNVKNSIEINAYYLQNENVNNIRTAKSNQSSEDKLCVIIYEGLLNNQNVSSDSSKLEISNICADYHYEWLQNRIFGQTEVFTFRTNIENIIDLNCKKRLYAFNNLFACKRIDKKQLSPDYFEVEIEMQKIMIK